MKKFALAFVAIAGLAVAPVAAQEFIAGPFSNFGQCNGAHARVLSQDRRSGYDFRYSCEEFGGYWFLLRL